MNYLLISPARCGAQLLGSSLVTGGVFHNEIFTFPKYTKQTNLDRIKNPLDYINFFMKKTPGQVTGAKILIPSVLKDKALEKILLCSKYKIVFMYRKNLLEAFVSGMIAHTTKQWMATAQKYRSLSNNICIENLDQAEQILNGRFSQIKYCLDIVKKENLFERVIQIQYEELFSQGVVNLEIINKVREFLTLQKLDNFSPSLVKQNNAETYSKIINKQELEDRFGSNFGYLGDNSVEPKIWCSL